MEKKMFSARIDPDLVKSLKHLAVDLEVSLSELVEQAIKDLLKKHEKGIKKGSKTS